MSRLTPIETIVNYELEDSPEILTVCTSERKWERRIKKLAEQYPNEVHITAENSDGSLVAKMPRSWFVFPKPPKKINLTDEELNKRRERMKSIKHNSKALVYDNTTLI